MATKKSQCLSLDDVVIPTQKIERNHLKYQFAPSKITSLADATQDILCHEGNSHAQMPKLEEVDYKKVRYVSLVVEGFGGYGSCCPKLNRQDYEELKKRCMATDNNDMIGQVVTVIYDSNMFTGFVAPNTYQQDLKRLDRRNARKSK